jgi:hypothetical protein
VFADWATAFVKIRIAVDASDSLDFTVLGSGYGMDVKMFLDVIE